MSVAVSRLVELEVVIGGGLRTFVSVGLALLEIRDDRLYRGQYKTFEEYTQQRWGFSRQRARQLIEASEVVATLEMTTTVVTPNERQARELVPLKDDPDAMAEVMTTVAERTNGKPTAAAIHAVVVERTEEETPSRTAEDDVTWSALLSLMDALAALSDASQVAATVPSRRRSATAKKLRELGTYLARIAWTLEGPGGLPG